MAEIKHRMGILYWKARKIIENTCYKIKKSYRQWKSFIVGIKKAMKIDYAKLKKSRCLIICAHPDDETIFFYSVIQELKPYIICMSNRGNQTRKNEFENALKYQGVSGTLFNFPDIINVRWKWIEPFLIRKLKYIKRNAPNIETIYTHNSVGESGHHHHFDLSLAVQKVFYDKEIFFTSQYEIEQGEVKNYDDKCIIIKNIYESQYKMLSMWCPWFWHYMKYEYFEKVKKDNDKYNSAYI